jgi:PAS domain S-box-containing protein
MGGAGGTEAASDLPVAVPFSELLENAPFGVVVIDEDSTIRYANGGFTDLLGHEPADLVGESLLRTVPERLRDAHTNAFESYLETGEKHLDWDRIELPALHRSGREVPISLTIRETPIDGELFYTGIILDDTESTQLREQLEKNVEVFHELYVVASNAAIPFETRQRRILEIGCQYLELPYGFITEITSTTQTILAAVGDHELLQPNAECPIEESYCRKTIEGEGFLSVANAVEEGWEEDPAYERFDLGSYLGGQLVVDGELFGTLCFASHTPRGHSFTESERTFVEMASRWLGYEFQQQRQTRQLERQNERLDRFASRVSHDLRNPLSAAKGRLKLAIERYGDDQDLLAVKRSLEDTDDRIDEMLEFARLGNVVTDPTPVSLSAAVEAAWATVETENATVEMTGDVELRGDRERIERLLENLFRNSVDHSAADGAVAVRVGTLSDAPGFYVADDGPGIPASDREAVLESGYTTSESGSGFGLAIVDEIATAHGWDVRITDAETGGARFEFETSTSP